MCCDLLEVGEEEEGFGKGSVGWKGMGIAKSHFVLQKHGNYMFGREGMHCIGWRDFVYTSKTFFSFFFGYLVRWRWCIYPRNLDELYLMHDGLGVFDFYCLGHVLVVDDAGSDGCMEHELRMVHLQLCGV